MLYTGVGILGLWTVVLIAVLIAWILSIIQLIDIAKQKGITTVGLYWFIGLFASPIVLGLIVLALPKKEQNQCDSIDKLPEL